ncbi:radical SAM protein [Tunturiibacter gelidoferens]|uniref:MoaA/NifB/PqqE/SkfB family radical SAM enzyme n=1 Tax=Tunturiibacter gelidiferens TaxID=3069689 RepID=A0ACC5NVP7_9BACT|nr:MoaA/NifB/PqqE/SkfB family radical SAM enzyme [Edaphobacter lichenicola]
MSVLHEVSTPQSITSLVSAITNMPILILNVHSLCNCRCVMCDIWKRDTREQIQVENLERHRLSLQNLGVRQVVLTGGEPLLHNDLAALCTFFRDQGIRITLLTTGLLLFKRANEVANLFDDIIISLDGPRQVHDNIRKVGGAFDFIDKGIAAVRQYNPYLPITCRTTVQKANHNHLRETVNAAKAMGLNSISFLAADLTSEAFNRPLVWPIERQNQIGLSADEITVLEVEIEHLILEYRVDFDQRFIVESAAKLRKISRRFREHLGQLSPKAPVCNAPWVSAVLEIDGAVRPCFFHNSIGNMTHSALEDVVNGKVAKEFRASLNVETNPICQRCVCSLNYSTVSDNPTN